MKRKETHFFIGTTAELIKLAPVIKELKRRKADFKMIASNQNVLHFDELKTLIGQQQANYTFKLKPIKLPFNIYSKLNIYIKFIIWIIKSFVNYLLFFGHEFKNLDKKDSLFIVHGDTVSSLLGAIIAKRYGIKLVHIESGLRSFNFFEPFPEELCRFIVSHLSDIHFCPNSWSLRNLKKNGGTKINTYQNTLIESFGWASRSKSKLDYRKFKKYFVLIMHRQEHVLFRRRRSKEILQFVLQHANRNLNCVFVTHPLTTKFLKVVRFNSTAIVKKYVHFIHRLPYIDFIKLITNAEFIITDGGSNQEEAYYMGRPCLLLRNRTERIEGLGKNVVLSKGNENVIEDFFNNYKRYRRDRIHIKTLPSKIIVDYLINR